MSWHHVKSTDERKEVTQMAPEVRNERPLTEAELEAEFLQQARRKPERRCSWATASRRTRSYAR